jgi:WD40 repeat protein
LTRRVYKQAVNDIAFRNDGKCLLVATAEGATLSRVRIGNEPYRLEQNGRVLASAISPSGKLLATSTEDHIIKEFETDKWTEVKRTKTEKAFTKLAYSPDGNLLATAGERLVEVLDSNKKNFITPKELACPDELDEVPSISFSDSNMWMAAVCGNSVHLLDLRSRAWIAPIVHKGPIESIAFSPDGKFIATRTARLNQRTLLVRPTMTRIWEAGRDPQHEVAWKSREEEDMRFGMRRNVAGQQDWPPAKEGGQTSLLSQMDKWKQIELEKGSELVSASGLWDAERNELRDSLHKRVLARLTYKGNVNHLIFSPDNRWLVAAGDDETVRVWPLKASDMIETACKRLNRNLSDGERKQYLPDKPPEKTCPDLP